ncbi:VWA domain-containing protein [Simiduia curdlanivorans]|uniref:VWA domain-containing protein n=1 Tax=Simiduia curdlanivorans TaxID=1492769 RepID=A0ABV8V7M6_9GAMM|nr:VWA domain-containing protein [Simiduia curdlanivorans]MDN3638784.1 VWA domain-containing protein [Simiduia curdlanivorans]
MLRICILLFVSLLTLSAYAQVEIKAVNKAEIGAELIVTLSGAIADKSFITIVKSGAEQGSYNNYVYVQGKTQLTLLAPSVEGNYEIRLLAPSSPYATLAKTALVLVQAKASIEAPSSVAAGANFELRWSGPNNTRDYLAIGNTEQDYITYQYTNKGSPLSFIAPDKPGQYELRYFLASGDTVIARKPIDVTPVTATINAPQTIEAGKAIAITWQGPNNKGDFISIVQKGAPEGTYNSYAYTQKGNPLTLNASDFPGEYEIRYMSGQAYATLGTQALVVTAASATINAPDHAQAGTDISVNWSGPDNNGDYITIVPANSEEGAWLNYTYTRTGQPLTLKAPQTPGNYELRYSTGASYATLARKNIRIEPSKEKPGKLLASVKQTAMEKTSIAIILDASGSMLQKMDGQRRIDIAKDTLLNLTQNHIPEQTPFALRIFGKEVGSCQSDLEIPLQPLNRVNVASKIKAINAQNNAKTPIAASIKAIREDLANAGKEKLVILITDGEETCEGDPAAEIEKLSSKGIHIRLNIIGFAIDDTQLAARFAHWSKAGNGVYLSAKNSSELGKALNDALQYVYEIRGVKDELIGEAPLDNKTFSLLPGEYKVRLKGLPETEKTVVIEADETTKIEF